MHFTPDELKDFPLWAVEENDTFAIMQWLGDWGDVIKAVQTAPAEEVPITEPEVYVRKPTNIPLVVKWLKFDTNDLDAILKTDHSGCDLITTSAHGALLSNGDLVIRDVRVTNHTGNPYSTHTLRVERAPTVLFTRGLGTVIEQDRVPNAEVDSMASYLEYYQYDKNNIMMPTLEDILGLHLHGYRCDSTLTDEQQLTAVIDTIGRAPGWRLNRAHLTVMDEMLYTTNVCPISGAVKLGS